MATPYLWQYPVEGNNLSTPTKLRRNRGCQLRRLRQGTELRSQHLALAPPYQPPLEPEHPAHQGSGRCCRCDTEASECLHVMPQGRQGQALRPVAALPCAVLSRECTEADLHAEVGFVVSLAPVGTNLR